MPERSPIDVGIYEGAVLAEKYRVDRVLGVGGMGIVVAAHHLGLDQRVAIKFLLLNVVEDGEATIRFEREARAAAKIKNEHIVRVMDVGTLDHGVPFIVMEYLDGEDLAARLRREPRLPVDRAVEIVLQTIEVLAEAHELGIVHRDLKPANLFCETQPADRVSIKVLDFGISKVAGPRGSRSDVSVTNASTVMGTPAYMSPEQMQAPRTVDRRTDIWAIGVILYELLAGELPFEGETFAQICVKVATHSTPPLRRTRPDVPSELEAVVRKCLEKDRENRYSSMAELAAALAPFALARSQASIERISMGQKGARMAAYEVPPNLPPMPMMATVMSWWQTVRRSTYRTKWKGLATIASAILLGIAGGWWMRAPGAATTSSVTLVQTIAAPSGPIAPSPNAVPMKLEAPREAWEPRSFVVPSELPLAAPVTTTLQGVHVSQRADGGAPAATNGSALNSFDSLPSCNVNFNSIPVSIVVLDGVELGLTPRTGFTVSPGSHVVTFNHADYDAVVRTFTCKPRESKAVSVRFAKPTQLDDDLTQNPYR